MIDVSELEERLRACIAARVPVLAPGRAVLAVSGGADSTATAAALIEAGIIDARASVVAHFDHRLRGGGAAGADRAAVEALCARYGIDLATGAWGAPRGGEAAAREARYRFLAGVASGRDLEVVVTGHTSDDQAETVLMHVLRGAGLHGLQGMQAEGGWPLGGVASPRLARPMLWASRAETRGYCAARGLRYVDDATNEDVSRLRARVRHELLPAMEATAPGAREALLAMAAAAREGVAALEAVASAALSGDEASGGQPLVRLSRAMLASAPDAVAGCAYRLALVRLLGDARDFERRHYAVLAGAARAATGSMFELPRGVVVTVDAAAVLVSAGALAVPAIAPDAERALPFEGVLGAWRLRVERAAGGVETVVAPAGSVVRGRRPGDRIRPRGMRGHKKLQDYYVDRKVPRRERDGAPVIACGAEVVWTPFGAGEAAAGVCYRVEAECAGGG
jgi:tRNA(Ile)-lysidine synthase